MDYYIPSAETEADFLKLDKPEELKFVDPACGSGHMLTYAFDLLYSIYEEIGYAPAEIPGIILANNLYGIEIDARAGALAAFALMMKARARQRTFFAKKVEPQVCVLESIHFTTLELGDLLTPSGDRDDEIAFWNQFSEAKLVGSLIVPRRELNEPLGGHLDAISSHPKDLVTNDIVQRANRVLAQAVYLSRDYAVVVTNPPYMGNRNMDSTLSGWLAKQYADTKTDLFAAFIRRCAGLGSRGAFIGIMSPNVWMYISSHLALREKLLQDWPLLTLVELPLSGFADATVQICAFVFRNQASDEGQAVNFIRLVEQPGGPESMSAATLAAIKDSETPWYYSRQLREVQGLPGAPVAYWLPSNLLGLLRRQKTLQEVSPPRQGIATSENARFLRLWWEVSLNRIGFNCTDQQVAERSGRKWFPYNKGGEFRRWYGNQEFVVNWQNDGYEIKNVFDASGKLRSRPQNLSYQFRPSVSWSLIGSGLPSFRYFPSGFLFDVAGMSVFGATEQAARQYLGLLNSVLATEVLKAYAPTLNFQVGDIARLPVPDSIGSTGNDDVVSELVDIAKSDWDEGEVSWNFQVSPLVNGESLIEAYEGYRQSCENRVGRVAELERVNNRYYLSAFRLEGQFPESVSASRVSLDSNLNFRYRLMDEPDLKGLGRAEEIRRFVSYAVGCMFGRYSLNTPGLVLADQGATLQDYVARVPTPTFMPDSDNVIPIVDGDWFEDDIVTRFRQFLRIAFGEKHFEENLRFVTEALGVKDLRDYFVKSFYADHLQRYKKRPIYWLFSSPKGSFNALIYLHRYTPATASTVLNEYLREFKAKLEATLGQQERLAAGGGTPRQQAAAQKEADRIRKMLLELNEYEHNVLYPLASQQIEIDLDDGVKVNYPKFGAALKKIPGLEAGE